MMDQASAAPQENPNKRKKADSSTDTQDLETADIQVSVLESINKKLDVLSLLHQEIKDLKASLEFTHQQIADLQLDNTELRSALTAVTSEKYPTKELHPDGKDSVWDARTGFTVPSHLIIYAGVVSCQTRIGNKTFKSPLYIVAVVGYKIYDLTLTPSHVRLSVGETLMLSCTVHTELNTGIEFNWTHSGGALTSVNDSPSSHVMYHRKKLWNSLELSNTLVVVNVTVDHTGEFTCTASSSQMEKSASAFLKVYDLEAARIQNNFTDQKVNVSATITLLCDATGTPNPTVIWTKNNQTVVEGSGVILGQHNHSLTIQRVKKEDSGLYTCTACNNRGCDSSQAYLTTEGVSYSL